eukprot:gene20517-24593_t
MSISVTIEKPQVEGYFDQYVKYQLTTEVSIPKYLSVSRTSIGEGGCTIFTVYRRFSDFVWLYDTMLKTGNGHILPPLPRRGTSVDISSEFIKLRIAALNKFMKFITNHPEQRLSDTLQTFLSERNQEVFDETVSQSKSLFGSLGDMFSWSNSDDEQIYMNREDPQYLRVAGHLKHLANTLGSFRSQVSSYADRLRQAENTKYLEQLGISVKNLGKDDHDFSSLLVHWTSKSQNGTFVSACDKFAYVCHTLSSASNKEIAESLIMDEIMEPIEERLRALQVVEEVCQQRKSALITLVRNTMRNTELQEKQRTLEGKVAAGMVELADECRVEAEKCEKNLRDLNAEEEQFRIRKERMCSELNRFHSETAQLLGNGFRTCAEMQAKLARQNAEFWDAVLQSVDAGRI